MFSYLTLLKAELLKELDQLGDQQLVMLKLTLPEQDNFYQDCINHARVLKVVALSGGYSREEANARLARNNGIALGNVVGSNVANVMLVLGLPAMFVGLNTADCDTRRSYVQMIAATVLFIALCFLGPITWVHGFVLLAALAWMLWDAFGEARAHKRETNQAAASTDDEEEVEGADPDLPWIKIFLFLGLGLIGLPLGADLLVDGSVNIARAFGMSETVIGLTLVAFGTSLPELAAVIAAAVRGHGDVALGNVIGSNMFNLLAIIGVASFVGDMRVPRELLHFDLWVMLGTSLLLAPIVFARLNIGRAIGAGLTAIYAVYVVLLLT